MQNDYTKFTTEQNPVVQLASLWQRRQKQLSGTFPRPLTRREMGQLKFMRTKVGPWAYFVTEWALNNWPQFSQRAKLDNGTDSAPTTPHIGFLLAHVDTALNLMCSIAQSLKPITIEEECFKKRVLQMSDFFKQQALALWKDGEEEQDDIDTHSATNA
jgi:hypothetical protein